MVHRSRFAVLPSFTFAATAQAALWCGLTPLFCDVDEHTWLPDPAHIDHLIRAHGRSVGVIIPYATFGNNLHLSDYDSLARRWRVPVVIDAAASLGSWRSGASHFGRSSRHPVIFSMHATKTFGTSEGGVVYSGQRNTIAAIRRMANFGFDEGHVVRHIGLNAKLPEVTAVQALAKLKVLPAILRHRARLAGGYRRNLQGFSFQKQQGMSQALQFFPARLSGATRRERDRLVVVARRAGIELRTYFSPPLHQLPFFATGTRLPVTESISRDILSLPLYDSMSDDDVKSIATVLNRIVARL